MNASDIILAALKHFTLLRLTGKEKMEGTSEQLFL